MPAPIAWQQIKQTGTVPPPRSGHTIVTIGKTHYLFGGIQKPEKYNDPKDLLPKNDLYALRIVNNQTVQWTLKQCSGDIPLGRAFHSACKVQEDKMFIFGGCFTSNEKYNDVYYLKFPAFQWSQPPNQKSVGPPKNAMSKIGGPQPRAYHSMTYFKNKIIIFGGHGGVDYQRTSFNDLYELDLDTFQWKKLKPKGNPPEPRGGHIASLVAQKDKMLVFGGWNFVLQFHNLFVFDFETQTWTDPELNHQIAKWNIGGILAPSIPSWKYFMFGGSSGSFFEGSNRTGSKYQNNVWYLDIDYMNWVPVKLQENQEVKPIARESPGCFYNADEQRFYVFGGWANEWLNDMWMLPVGSITGPPYAIESIKPKVGPLTGKTKLSIYGAGFKQSYGQITVRFFGGKAPIDAVGVFKEENLIECQTPPFDQPKKCQIRVLCGKYDLTITSAEFTYFLNTKADQTICYGPGLLQDNHVDAEGMFFIQARNAEGHNRTTGGDEFRVKIKRLDVVMPEEQVMDDKQRKAFDALPEEQKKAILDKKAADRKAIADKMYITPKIIDHQDGTYLVKYKVPEQCKCQVEINFLQDGKQQPIRGQKFTSSFGTKGNPKITNEFDGPLTIQFINNQLQQISKFLETSKQNIDTRNKSINDNVKDLLKVMNSLKALDEHRDDIYLTLDRIQQVLKTFERRYEKKKEFEMKKCMKLMQDNKTITFVAAKVEKQINGPKNIQAVKTKERIKKFEDRLKEMQTNLKRQSFYFYDTGVQGSFQRITEYKQIVEGEKKTLNEFIYYEEMFKFTESQTTGCNKIIENIQIEVGWMLKLWEHIKKCDGRFDDYLKLKWTNMDIGQMEDEIKKMRTGLQPIKIADRRCNTFIGISEQIKRWGIFIPMISDLKHDSMITPDARNWKKVKDTVKQDFKVDENLELKLLWNYRLFDYKQTIEQICEIAKNEAKMEKQINTIIEFWKVIQFELVPLKNSNVSTLKMLDQNFQTLQGHQLSINTMLLSKFVAFFQKLFQQWKQDLGSVYDVVQLLSEVQKTWSFLQNLFIHSEEVKKQLPQTSNQFVGIDKDMREIMKKGGQVKNILKFCTIDGMYKKLDKIQGQLKICQKALNQYLDSKRKAFPRFYFVSVLDLLDILSNGNSPLKVNKHSPKIFQAVQMFSMEESGQRPSVVGMKSGVGVEYVKLIQPLKLVGKVQTYLQDIINAIVATMRAIATKSFSSHSKMQRSEWIKVDPAQITLLVNNIVNSNNIQECFKKISDGSNVNALKDYHRKSVQNLTSLIKMVQGQLTKEQRQKIMCLITLDTNARDVIEKLDVQNVKKPDAFQWQSLLKFYWTDGQQKNTKDCQIRIADAVFWYSYEYLGNGPRLVVTPLTDRIYVTATQALHLKMGCAPAGPAGTGKTQTTKDLSFALAKAIYVFNCSSEMNYESMGNIYKGLASSGCWGCFDQFNRLLPEVLSVCSVQFKSVTDAVKAKKQRFILQGDQISLDPTCGVFITMNPGYLGRAQLPQGLKALFRPITVVVPDLQLICQNMLMAQGFVDAKVLAKKFVTLYMLCRDLLSKQLHYDWGLRAIKSVLVVAGVFKRNQPTVSQQALLMRALRDFNLPKIAFADLDIFFGLLGDLFPKIQIQRKRDMDFEKVITECAVQSMLYPHDDFILKIVQLKELLQIRHCVFELGPPGSGKTKTWQMLGKAQDKIGKKTTIVDINPKTVSTKDLYGYNLPSKQWKDGLLSKTMRTLSQVPDQNPKWILLDGDLDANWIESMNSVMDDNKILTLANNQRIPLKGHMRMIFEIRDLRFASPATVSRAGILYISDDSGYQWQSYIASWLDKLPKMQSIPNGKQKKEDLKSLFKKYIAGTLFYIKKNCKLLVPVAPISMVASLCAILEIILKEEYSNIEYVVVFAIIWCCGGALAEKQNIDYRKQFSNWWKGEWKTAAKFPSKGTVFDYYVHNPRNSDGGIQPCKFAQWVDTLVAVDYDTARGDIMSNIAVPTKQSIATEFYIKRFIFVNHPVLLIGLAGCGKTALAKGCLRSIVKEMPDNFNYQLINFSYYIDSSYLQVQLEQFLKKIAGKQFGPPGKQKLIYFIDDLNMPQLDQYDTQSAIALLRQHADYEHWYDVGKLTLKDIVNTQFLAAMNPSAGSFFVDPRLMRHFWTVSIPFPDNQSLFLIYSTFLSGHLKRFKPTLQQLAPLIIRSALTLHQNVISSFRKTAINFHYEFNLRHLSGIFQGLLFSDPLKFNDPEKLVKLWIHESQRTYGDRLISMEHLVKYNSLMFDLIKKSFARYSLNRYFSNTPENLIFCNFASGMNGQDRLYDILPNDKLLPFIQEGLTIYNDNNPVMNLVLFEDAMKHVCRITRIITPSSGHGLMVGVGGSGKQSLTRLGASMNYMTTFQITISSTYSINDLKTDLQTLYQKTGVKQDDILFLFTEGQITNQRFLVYINDLLASGQIAQLYTSQQKEQIINAIRNKVKSEGKVDSRDNGNCWNWYIDKVKQKLHMSLCFSPVGQSLRRRARQFPALVNSTVIDWYFPWPKDALMNVATRFLEQQDLGDQNSRKAIINFMPTSFESVNKLSGKLYEIQRRYVYTTPKSFLELIKLFKSMLLMKRDDLLKNRQRYQSGLVKLRQTAEQVAIIEQQVKVKQIQAQVKKQEADRFAAKVKIEKEKVQIQNEKAEVQQGKCSVIKKDVQQKKLFTQTKLQAAGPLVKQAQQALNSIQKKDFQIAKSFANPPAGVPQVFSATIWLLSGFYKQIDSDKAKKPKAFDWKASQKLMKDPQAFMVALLGFKQIVNNNELPPANVAVVKRDYLSNPQFDPAIIQNKSKAAAGLCSWVLNIVKFWDVIQEVGPLRKQLQQAKQQLQAATIKLNEVQQIVRKLNAQLSQLNKQFQQAEDDKQRAINEAQRCARRLNLAQRLIAALGSQNQRWANSIVGLDSNLKYILGDVLLASAFVSYAGPFNKSFRDKMMKEDFEKFFKTHKITTSPENDPIKLLTDESTAAKWNKQSLPSDKVSIENGTILTNSQRYPLMIDPQLQGISWIRQKEKDNKLKSLRLGSKNINRQLQIAVQNGYSALIQNMGQSVDAILMPIIARSFIKKGKSKILKFAGKDLSLHANFKLFLQTKLSNPHYPPQIQAQATLINFTVTQDGLGDQLLYLIVKRERPDLAAKKLELITQQNDFKIKLKQLQDQLLYKLANAKGDILDDIALIENLQYSKKISIEIQQKVEIAKVTQAKINITSQLYRPAASRGALIYFLLSDLTKIHSFYKFSLESFIDVINRAIDEITEGIQGKQKMYEIDAEGKAIIPEVKIRKKKRKTTKVEGQLPQITGDTPAQVKQGEAPATTEVKIQSKPQIADQPDQEEGAAGGLQNDDNLSPEELKVRITLLIDNISQVSFHFTRRGLFEKHKLIVSTLLTFRILQRNKQLDPKEVEHLILGKTDPNPPPVPEPIKGFLNQAIWAFVKGLQQIPVFSNLGSSMESEYLVWKKWYQQQRVQQLGQLPKSYKDLSKFHKLLLYRAMRPDRVASALTSFVGQIMGQKYVQQPPFSIFQTFAQTNSKIPTFFVLFPGVDPTPEVQRVAAKYNISISNKKFTNISMGQGQQKPAKQALFAAAEKGHWILLQNLHLMQTWLKGLNGLQGMLETAFANCHPNFRVFLSSEPPPLPDMQIIPESILQISIKVSNQAPQYLKANLRRAFANFDQKFIDKCDKKPNQFKSCLFALCYFHSLVVGRKKFGSQGWSRIYSFNDGDLTICADVLFNYLTRYDVVPWQDLRYIFGQIMYGGHITDDWDRRTNATYLKVLFKPQLLLPNFNLLYHLFKSPDPAKLDYEGYRKYIEEKVPPEVPQMFGMHPNAQIGYLTLNSEVLFDTILSVEGGKVGGGGSKDDQTINIIADFKTRAPAQFSMLDINLKIKDPKDKTPYVVVCLQQCERMNNLLQEIKRSLQDLRLGLTGALNITDAMENLQRSLAFNKVPATWEAVAYPSRKTLTIWFNQLIERCAQLQRWSSQLITPKSLCISHLFNPMSFLTAIMQNTSRQKVLPLDNMTLQTRVTLLKSSQEVHNYPDTGAYVHGLILEGAAWELGAPGQEGYLIEQKPKQLHPKLPVVNVVAVQLKNKKVAGQYNCPVYYTTLRGATFIFKANLNMQSQDSDQSKWVLSGTCLLLSDD